MIEFVDRTTVHFMHSCTNSLAALLSEVLFRWGDGNEGCSDRNGTNSAIYVRDAVLLPSPHVRRQTRRYSPAIRLCTIVNGPRSTKA